MFERFTPAPTRTLAQRQEEHAWYTRSIQAREEARRYKIERCYFRGDVRRRTIATGYTLAEAQAHCKNPETSSSTCTNWDGRARTKRMGPWFDSYSEE